MCGLIVRVRVVPRRTVVDDIDRRFDNLSGSHHQSHVNCVSSVYGIYVSGQLSRNVIGCFKSNRWLKKRNKKRKQNKNKKRTTLLSTIYKRTTESTGTLLNVFHSVQTTTNDLLHKVGLLTWNERHSTDANNYWHRIND